LKPQYADDEASQEVIEGEEAPMSVSISLERDLEEYLVRNLGQLEAGLKLYSKGSTTGRQFNTDTGKVDILASDRTGDFVVIELKAGIANSAALGQVLAYMSWVRQHIAQGKEVRGIIIADDFDTKLKHAVHETPSVCLKKYEVSFTFADIPDDR
jgi:RecB family endonuclease NucS